MGDKTNKIIKNMEIRTIIVAILGIAILILIANYTYKTIIPPSSAFGPYPIDAVPVSPGIGDIPETFTNLTFSDPIQLTGNPDDPWEGLYHFGGASSEYVRDADDNYILFQSWDPQRNTRLFVLDWENMTVDSIMGPGGDAPPPLESAISKDNVVYQSGCNIYLYNLTTKETTVVTEDVVTEPYSCPNRGPDIHTNIIVWSRYTDTEKGIWAYNIINGQKRKVDPSTNRYQIEPKIFRNNVVWKEGSSLIFYDMKNRERIVLNVGESWLVSLGRSEVVWQVPVLPEAIEFTEYVYHIDTRQTDILYDNNHESKPAEKARNGLWEGFYGYNSGVRFNWGLSLMDINRREFYQVVDGFRNNLDQVAIVGRESEFIYPPPHKFKIIFSGAPEYGFEHKNIYMVEATVSR